MPEYLIRRPSGYHLRVAVPYHLRSIVGLSEVKRSLGPLPKKEARLAAQQIGAALLRYFHLLGMNHYRKEDMQHSEIRQRIKEIIDSLLIEFEKEYYYAPDRRNPIPDWEHEEHWFDNLTATKSAIDTIKKEMARGEIGGAFKMAYDLATQWGIAADSGEFKFLCKELQEAYFGYFEAVRGRMEGKIPRFIEPTTASAGAATQAPNTPTGPTISEAWKEYEQQMLTVGGKNGWGTAKTHQKHVSVMEDFIDYFDDAPLNAIRKRPEILEFRDAMKRRPNGRNKFIEFRTLSLRDLMKLDIPEEKQCDESTINNNYYCVAQFFKWCVETEYLQANPCTATYPIYDVKDEDGGNKTPPFAPKELSVLFAPANIKTNAGQRNHVWHMLIALYQGMRAKEIAQLQVADIKEEGGCWYFDINDNRRSKLNYPKSLKNKNSKRRIPIHPALLDLGFLDLVKVKKVQGDDAQILDSFDIGKQLTNWFIHPKQGYMAKCAIEKTTDDGASKRYHSFRATFITQAEVCHLDAAVRQQLVGHARQDISRTHGGYINHQLIDWLTRAKSEISKVSFQLDLPALKTLLTT